MCCYCCCFDSTCSALTWTRRVRSAAREQEKQRPPLHRCPFKMSQTTHTQKKPVSNVFKWQDQRWRAFSYPNNGEGSASSASVSQAASRSMTALAWLGQVRARLGAALVCLRVEQKVLTCAAAQLSRDTAICLAGHSDTLLPFMCRESPQAVRWDIRFPLHTHTYHSSFVLLDPRAEFSGIALSDRSVNFSSAPSPNNLTPI